MGLGVTGLGLFGIAAMYLIYVAVGIDEKDAWQYLSGFGFGASCIALFARVGGGVYTKAADVGADLVGKVEAGIPEVRADPRACVRALRRARPPLPPPRVCVSSTLARACM